MKIISILVICLLMLPLALAGQTFKIDFTKENPQIIEWSIKDRINFEYNNSHHQIVFTDFVSGSSELSYYFYVDKEDGFDRKNNLAIYSTLNPNPNKALFIDVDNNQKDDLKLKFLSSQEDKVKISVELLNQNNQPNQYNYIWILFGLIVIIIAILYFLFFKK